MSDKKKTYRVILDLVAAGNGHDHACWKRRNELTTMIHFQKRSSILWFSLCVLLRTRQQGLRQVHQIVVVCVGHVELHGRELGVVGQVNTYRRGKESGEKKKRFKKKKKKGGGKEKKTFLCVCLPSLRNWRPISYTRSMPPTTSIWKTFKSIELFICLFFKKFFFDFCVVFFF